MHIQEFSHDKLWPFSRIVLEVDIFCFLSTTHTLNTIEASKKCTSKDSEIVVVTKGFFRGCSFLGVLVFGHFCPGLGKHVILFVMVN